MIFINIYIVVVFLVIIFLIAAFLAVLCYKRQLPLSDSFARFVGILGAVSSGLLILSLVLICFLTFKVIFIGGDYSQVKVEELQKFSGNNEKLVVQTSSGEEYTLISDDVLIYPSGGFLLQVNDEHFSDCFVPAEEPVIVERFGKLCITLPMERNTVYVNQELYDQLMGVREIPVSDWDGEQDSSSQEE